jgi:excisionase family DNA binding protein
MATQKTKIVMTTEDLVPILEVAKELKVNFSTVYRWIRNEQVNAVQFGKHFYIPRAELESLKIQRGIK